MNSNSSPLTLANVDGACGATVIARSPLAFKVNGSSANGIPVLTGRTTFCAPTVILIWRPAWLLLPVTRRVPLAPAFPAPKLAVMLIVRLFEERLAD